MNLAPRDFTNPYADYSIDQLGAFLGSYKLLRDPGESFEYSNLGVGLLGHLLANKAGTSYEALVTQRLLAPLGMTSTAITLTPECIAEAGIVNVWTAYSAVPVRQLEASVFPGDRIVRNHHLVPGSAPHGDHRSDQRIGKGFFRAGGA